MDGDLEHNSALALELPLVDGDSQSNDRGLGSMLFVNGFLFSGLLFLRVGILAALARQSHLESGRLYRQLFNVYHARLECTISS